MLKYIQTKPKECAYIMEISKNELYIKRIRDVIKSEIKEGTKIVKSDGRSCDAFVYILSGKCTYEFVNGNKFTVCPGDILYLSNQSLYNMNIHNEKYQFIFCDFEFEDITAKNSNVYSPDKVFNTENKFQALLKAYNNSQFADCMSYLYGIYGIIAKTNAGAYLENNTKSKIRNIKSYIDANFYDKSINVSHLAEKLGMSEVYFRKLFKMQYNISPSQYIIAKRIEKSKKLLKYPFLSISDCAVQSGFSTVQYFTRTFTNINGITPDKFRKQE